MKERFTFMEQTLWEKNEEIHHLRMKCKEVRRQQGLE